MKNITIYLANSNEIIREGLRSMVGYYDDIEVVAEASTNQELFATIAKVRPQVLVIDYCSDNFKTEDISVALSLYPELKVLAISSLTDKEVVANSLKAGVSGHILNCCDRQEVVDAIYALAKGESFYCGKVLEALKDEEFQTSHASCAPITLSDRELQIIQLIAEGLTNKEVAKKLFISNHTVTTHRKNIMNKLGINNTAGIVIYAIKSNLISPNKFLFSPIAN